MHRILSKLPDVRVVLIRTQGLWGSSFSWAYGHAPKVGQALRRVAGLIASGLFWAPRREVDVTLAEPDDLPRTADRITLNRYLEGSFNESASPARYVPYSVWEKGGVRLLPEPKAQARPESLCAVSPATRRIVVEHLRQLTGVSDVTDEQHLARDLGLDSLAVTDLVVWLEKEFGFALPSPESLQSVGNVILAACGEMATASDQIDIPAPDSRWNRNPASIRSDVPEGKTIGQVFLTQARRNPDRAIVADMQRGSRSFRDLITAIFVLRKKIRTLPGERIGILLPASVAADTVYFATLFAGKTPVMVNWTTGPRNILHSLDLAEVKRVLTSQTLISRLKAQGLNLDELGDRLVRLEQLAGSIGWWSKLIAAMRARLSCARCKTPGKPTRPLSSLPAGRNRCPRPSP